MAFTFRKVLEGMGNRQLSLFDPEGAKIVAELAEKAKGVKLTCRSISSPPTVSRARPDTPVQTGLADDKAGIPAGWMGLDAGPKSRELFAQGHPPRQDHHLERPSGRVRVRAFAEGTKAMADAIAAATEAGAITVVGGGDTATAAKKFGVVDKVTHCSTGGGASLEFLEGKVLPGVAFFLNVEIRKAGKELVICPILFLIS
jgi:phosphoglycerate kinase